MHEGLKPTTAKLAGSRWGPMSVAALWTYALALLRCSAGQVRPLWRTLATLAACIALTWLGLSALSAVTGTPMPLLTRDLAATTGAKFYIGLLSGLGALLWAAAATVSLFASVALRRISGQQERASCLRGAACLLAAMGADDFFMLHEVVYPKFGLEEEVLVLFYGAGFAALLLRYRVLLLASDVLLLLLGGLFSVVSVLVDGFVRDATALEDIFKFTAIVCWLTYFWRLALAGLRPSGS